MENNANVSSAKRKMEAELEQTRELLKDVEEQVQMVSGGGGGGGIMWWRGCFIIPPCLVKPVCQDGGGMEWMQYVTVLFTGVGFILIMNTG